MFRRRRGPLQTWQEDTRTLVLARSDRLLLTALRPDDYAEFIVALRDPEVMEWQGYDEAIVERFEHGLIASMTDRFRNHPMQLAVRDRATDEFVGSYSYSLDADDLGHSVALGWWLTAPHRGKGLGHESLQMVLRWLHDDVQVTTVRIGTRHDNVRAIAQIERSGARLQSEHPTPLPNGTSPMGKWYVHE